jgi:hypothetical protein
LDLAWFFYDLTETVTVGEAIWSLIAILGVLFCTWFSIIRFRTWYEIIVAGIDGSTRLLAVLRLIRVGMLGVVFLGFAIIGGFAMTWPTPRAIDPQDPRDAIPTITFIGMELFLFIKVVLEEILETAINNMRDMTDAARSQNTPRLSD